MSGKRPEAGTMCGDFSALLQLAECSDVTLVAGNVQLPAHSQILAARSPVFAAALRHDMQEARSRRIEIPDVREEVLRQLLSFVYSDETPQLADVAGELLGAADKYDIPLLKSRCAQQLQRDLNVENAATAAALAVRHCCPDLQSAAVSFVVARHPGVMATDSWARVLRDDTETAVEICKQVAAAALQPVTDGESAELQSSNSSTATMSGKRPEAGTMCGDFGALLQSAEGADVTLVVGNVQLPAHSQILAARSPVFAAALRHDKQEARSRRIEIPDVREEVLRQLLSFVYSDETLQLADVAGELLVAADKYDLPVLKSRCAQQLQRDLNVENAATAAALAVRHCCPELQNAAVSFVVGNLSVMATGSWARVFQDDVQIGLEICRQVAAAALQPVTDGESAELQSSDSRDLTEENGKRLIAAAKEGAAEEVQRLLAAGAKVEARDDDKRTPLHWAARKGHVEVVRCLLSAGAVVDSRNVRHSTPLHKAAINGHAAVVRLLVASGAYHSARNQWGMTPLHYAAKYGHEDATAALLELGADKEVRNKNGSTPLEVAKDNNTQQVIDMLT